MPFSPNLSWPGPPKLLKPQPVLHLPAAIGWTLSLADTTTSTDQLANDVGKKLADTTTSTDQLANRLGKKLADTTTSTDALANRPGKNLSDTTTATDALANRLGKTLADSSATTDSLARVMAFHAALADTTTSTDLASLHDTPGVSSSSPSPFVDGGEGHDRDNGRWNYDRRRW